MRNAPELFELGSDERGEDRFTTREMVEAEQRLHRAAELIAEKERHEVGDREREAALARAEARGLVLSGEQADALAHVTDGRDLGMVVGYAGTGKSAMLGVAREAWEVSGFEVRGVALSDENLESGSGIASRTIASMEHGWGQGRDMLTSHDVLVIDEASMVDIEMMAATLSALPAHAQCILLGDKDQLASVEAGSVLGDLCRRAEASHYTPATADWLAQATGQPLPAEFIDPAGQPLDQAITMLRVSHRFNEHSGIGQLAKAINQPGHAQSDREKQQAVTAVLRHGYPDIHHLVMSDDAALDKLVIHGSPSGFAGNGEGRTDHQSQPIAPPTGYRHYLNVLHAQRPRGESFEKNQTAFNAWASEVLSAYSHFQLLCALRKGPWGVEGLNQRIASTLRREKLLFGSDYTLEKGWYEGRPVLVTQNDYGLKLMNGDIGITMAVPDPRNPQQKLLRVAFPSSSAASDTDNPIRWVLPSRLHAVETVFAMSVHKSQGSEFLHTALLLPPTLNPILTRELVYTGITRAREWLTVVETKRGVLNEAVVREVVRVSGVGG